MLGAIEKPKREVLETGYKMGAHSHRAADFLFIYLFIFNLLPQSTVTETLARGGLGSAELHWLCPGMLWLCSSGVPFVASPPFA